MEPLVSFIVNCYNGELYLKRCLDSILTQTYQNWELIFWDNASTDHSKEIFTSYGDKRFKYFNSDVKVSLGQARAWAVDVCRGDYISFLDVDDEWLPQKTEIQIREIQKDSYVLSYGSINEINADNPSKRKITTPRYSSGNIFGEQLVNFEANLPSSMIKRSALIQKKLNFDPNIKASEEYCLYMQLIYGEKVCVVTDILANYFVRSDSLTNECMDRWAYEREYTLNRIIESHPEVCVNYKTEMKEAFARAIYYKARYLVSIGKKNLARKELQKVSNVNYKYQILFILLFFPTFIWENIHLLKNMR